MKEQNPRVIGLPTSKRELGLLRVFKTMLAVVSCLAAIQGVQSVYERAASGFGYDFYQFWLGGDVLRAHRAEGRHEVLDVYTDAAHVKIGARYVKIASTRSLRQRKAAQGRSVVDTASSPFFYWVFSILTPGDYDREYKRYILFSVACMVAAIIAFAWRLRYSVAGMGAAIALASISAPVYSEFHVINFNFPELAICFFYLFIRQRARDSARFAPALFMLAGVLMGLLAAFKPNLFLLPVLLGVSGLVSRRWRGVLAEAGGFAIGVVGAVAVSSWSFGGISCWMAWGRVILALGSQPTMPSYYGNFSITRNIYEITGRNLISLFSVIGIAVAIGAIWLGRRPSQRPRAPHLERALYAGRALPAAGVSRREMPALRSKTDRDVEFRHDMAIFGIAVAVTLLSSGLAWVHYPILLFPFLLLVASPARIGIASQITRYALLSIVVLLLLYPPPEELQKLLPMRIDVNIRSWIHCTQAAVIVTLGIAVWFESRLLDSVRG